MYRLITVTSATIASAWTSNIGPVNPLPPNDTLYAIERAKEIKISSYLENNADTGDGRDINETSFTSKQTLSTQPNLIRFGSVNDPLNPLLPIASANYFGPRAPPA